MSTVGPTSKQKVIKEEGEVAEASGFTPNCISSADVSGPAKTSAFHQSRKLLAHPCVINGLQCPGLLVYCGSPVTLKRDDVWEQLRQPNNKLFIEEEKIQGVTQNGFRIFGHAHFKLKFECLQSDLPVVGVDKIAHKLLLGNDSLIQYQCGLLNSDGVIVFGKKSVPYTLFRSTINLICTVISQWRTEIEPYEKAVIPGLLDSFRCYNTDQTLLFEPRTTELMQPLVAARVVVNFTLAVVPILVSNISVESVTIPKCKVLADKLHLKSDALILKSSRLRQVAWL